MKKERVSPMSTDQTDSMLNEMKTTLEQEDFTGSEGQQVAGNLGASGLEEAMQRDETAGSSNGRTFAFNRHYFGGYLAALIYLAFSIKFLDSTESGFFGKLAVGNMIILGLAPIILTRGFLADTGIRAFNGVGDFFVSTCWAWVTLMVCWIFNVSSQGIILGMIGALFVADSLMPNGRHLRRSPAERFIIALSRALAGILGVFMLFLLAISWVLTVCGYADDKTSANKFFLLVIISSILTGVTHWYFRTLGISLEAESDAPGEDAQEAEEDGQEEDDDEGENEEEDDGEGEDEEDSDSREKLIQN